MSNPTCMEPGCGRKLGRWREGDGEWKYFPCSRSIEEHELLAKLAAAEVRVRELEEAVEKEERAHLDTIRDRDAAEEALGEAYQLVMDEWPEWSSSFGYKEAFEAMNERLGVDLQKRDTLTATNAALEEKLGEIDGEYLKAVDFLPPMHKWSVEERRIYRLVVDRVDSRKKGAEHGE